MADFNTSKTDGDTVDASEWNQLASIDNLISTSGQTPSTSNLNQTAIAAARYSSGGQFYTDSGIANAYVLSPISPFKSPVSSGSGEGYFVGMTIKFRAGNPNTGASTVNINSAGVKNLKKENGTTDLAAGDIPTDRDVEFRYNGTLFVLVSPNSFIGFRAYRNTAQSITSNTRTKVQLNAESFDSNGQFDPATNYRFLPTIAGYYSIIGNVSTSKSTKIPRVIETVLYKNGVASSYGSCQLINTTGATAATISANVKDIIYFNGSTDYVELYTLIAYSDGSSPDILGSDDALTFMTATYLGA